MATTAVQNPPAESKSAKKKKAKAEAATNGTSNVPAVPDINGKEESSHDPKGDGDNEHPFIKELTKHIRNVHKKLGGLQKVESIISENPNTSLDDLVSSRKINADQKASILKKPQLQQQLAGYEEQIAQYRKIDADYQAQLAKQKDELTSQHQKEVETLKQELQSEGTGTTSGALEMRSKLLTFTKFLRLAAAKRMVPEEKDTEEALAFEGALLVVYGGDDNAVETAVNIIEGSDEFVPNTEGVPTTVKYSQVKQVSIDHAPYEEEERWVDSVAEASSQPIDTDPTIAHAGLTELNTTGQVNGIGEGPLEAVISPPQGGAGDDAGNAAGDKWDTNPAGGDSKVTDEGFEMIPRPADEVDTPAPSALPADALLQKSGNSWADEPPAYDDPPAGFNADAGDVKTAIARGESQVDEGWGSATEPSQPLSAGGWAESSDAAAGAGQEDGDGFHQVPGRHRGRGRGRGEGEFRGRGRGRGGFRGDGEFRGRGRGGFRGRGEGGEFRGRGRGRGGPRGGAEGVARGS